MFEEINRRKTKANKKLKLTILLTVFCWLASWGIVFNESENIFLMINIMMMFLRIEDFKREFILTSLKFVVSICPTIIYFVGTRKIADFRKECRKLEIEESTYLVEKDIEECKSKLQEILKDIHKLSRGEQMELLNYTKDSLRQLEEINKSNNNLFIESSGICWFQKELEDVLFPSFDDNEKGYSRKRTKTS